MKPACLLAIALINQPFWGTPVMDTPKFLLAKQRAPGAVGQAPSLRRSAEELPVVGRQRHGCVGQGAARDAGQRAGRGEICWFAGKIMGKYVGKYRIWKIDLGNPSDFGKSGKQDKLVLL